MIGIDYIVVAFAAFLMTHVPGCYKYHVVGPDDENVDSGTPETIVLPSEEDGGVPLVIAWPIPFVPDSGLGVVVNPHNNSNDSGTNQNTPTDSGVVVLDAGNTGDVLDSGSVGEFDETDASISDASLANPEDDDSGTVVVVVDPVTDAGNVVVNPVIVDAGASTGNNPVADAGNNNHNDDCVQNNEEVLTEEYWCVIPLPDDGTPNHHADEQARVRNRPWFKLKEVLDSNVECRVKICVDDCCKCYQ